uniref:Lipocalin n=1 Tax=Rhipicephalus zambeziensis TaxID=60191 RepID=A0A224YDW0_9ACAR
MKLLVLSLALVLALSDVQGNPAKKPEWANEAKYGAHQNSWESIKADKDTPYLLTKATYDKDLVWGNNFTCLSVKATGVNEEEKSINATIKYTNQDKKEYQYSYEKVRAVYEFDYTQNPNAILYETKDGHKFKDVLAYSGGNCDIYYVLPSDELPDGGYELWTVDLTTSNTCTEKFESYAKGMNVRDVFTHGCEKI